MKELVCIIRPRPLGTPSRGGVMDVTNNSIEGMRKLFGLFLFTFYGIAGWSQQLPSDIQSRLERLGLDMRRGRWHVQQSFPELQIYENANSTCFFMVATTEYARYVQNPVLAYSTESGFHATASDWKENLICSYQEQLQQLKSSGRMPEGNNSLASFLQPTTQVERLTKTKWGQDYPYNEQCPLILAPYTHQLTGCVATAMSQLMYYHQYPMKGRGRYVGGTDRQRVDILFDIVTPQWNAMQTEYSTLRNSKQDVGSIAQLMGVNAKAVSSDFRISDTASDHLAARTVLVNYWNYAPTCKFIRSERQSVLIAMINQDLDNRLPVMVTGGEHSFLCDGRNGDFYHFNLGWRGDANGYYRFLIDNKVDEDMLETPVMQEIVCNIRPSRENREARLALTLSKPGMLATVLANQSIPKEQVTRLKLSGSLNGDDIALLRRMAGATDGWNREAVRISNEDARWTGQLAYLDLSEATFVKDDKLPYLRIKAKEGRFNWQLKDYVVDEMSDAEYRKFIKRYVGHGDGYSYVEYAGERCMEFYLLPRTVTPMMFFDCQNLQDIILPSNTKAIMGCAFQWCNALTTVDLPASVKEIEAGAFAECYLLEEVRVKTLPTETCHHVFPFKKTGQYGQFIENRHQGIFEGNNKVTCRGLVKDGVVLTSIKYKKVL